MTEAQATESNTETSEESESPEVQTFQRLTKAQQHQALRSVFEYLSSFDRVPGNQTGNWSRVLDTVAIVANNIGKELEDTKE